MHFLLNKLKNDLLYRSLSKRIQCKFISYTKTTEFAAAIKGKIRYKQFFFFFLHQAVDSCIYSIKVGILTICCLWEFTQRRDYLSNIFPKTVILTN